MTSHITVSTSQTGTTSTGFTTPSSGDSSSSGGFGAILDAIGSFGKSIVDGGSQTTAATTPHPGFVHLDSAGASTPATDATTSADALAKAMEDATATASVSAPLAATAATDPMADSTDTTSGTPPKLLSELVDSLAELQKAQQNGTPVDQDLLKRVKKAIDAIANFLATQQPIQGAPADPTSGTDGSSPTTAAASTASATTPATAASAFADAAKATLAALDTKLEALSSSLAQSAPDISTKLDQLAKALDPAKLSADTISQLGLDSSDSSADPKLMAAINGLVNGKAETTTALSQPALAAPTLKLPEGTALSDNRGTSSSDSGKAAPSASTATPTTAPTTTASQDGSGSDASTDSSKKGSASLAATAGVAADKARDAADTPAASTPNTTAPQAAPVAAVQAQAAQAAYVPATAAAVTLAQVPVEIVRHIQQGDSHFQIKLDPADLGRIDVKLAIDSSGAVNARVTAERPETLALLQRDSGSLNQALTQAGLDGSKTNLQFSLSQNPFAGQNSNGNGSNSSSQPQIADDDAGADTIAPASAAVLYRGTASSSGLNIVV